MQRTARSRPGLRRGSDTEAAMQNGKWRRPATSMCSRKRQKYGLNRPGTCNRHRQYNLFHWKHNRQLACVQRLLLSQAVILTKIPVRRSLLMAGHHIRRLNCHAGLIRVGRLGKQHRGEAQPGNQAFLEAGYETHMPRAIALCNGSHETGETISMNRGTQSFHIWNGKKV